MKGICAFPQAPDWGTPTRYQDPMHYNWHGNCRFAIRKPQYLWTAMARAWQMTLLPLLLGVGKSTPAAPNPRAWAEGPHSEHTWCSINALLCQSLGSHFSANCVWHLHRS